MMKSFVSAVIVLGIGVVAAPPVGAADCGLAALLSPCSAPLPTAPVPVTVPVPLPAVEPMPAPLPVASPSPGPAPAAPAGQRVAVPDAAERILQLVNEERAGARLSALTASPQIASIAAGHSMAMAERRTIWHNDAYMGAANRRALGATALGENVAMNATIEDAHRRLMASPGHRANILRAGFDAVGMAVARDETGMLYVTQDFADVQREPGFAPTALPGVPKSAAKSAGGKPARPTSAPAVVLRTAAVASTPVAAGVASSEPVAASVVPAPRAPSSSAILTGVASSGADAPNGAATLVLVTLVALALLGGVGVAGVRVGATVIANR